jgi:antitoxin component of MazEF toxin-antitoxin module
LNNKAYVSSPTQRHFVKYRIPIKEPTRNRRKMFDRLAMVNLNRQGQIFENIDDKEIENKILQQIQLHYNNPKVKKRWENTKAFIEYVSNMR